MYTDSQQKFMLGLARNAIKHYLFDNSLLNTEESEIDSQLKEKRGVFVTLTINNRLRGCIGHIEAIQPLYLDIIDNAVSSAFNDPRFDPLQPDEFERIKIEISILSVPKSLKFKDSHDLLKKITPYKDGIILKRGYYQATYLPQVWEEIGQKETFLNSLCIKAGLSPDSWQKEGIEVQTYAVEKFKEN